jgi:hypothetical protein
MAYRVREVKAEDLYKLNKTFRTLCRYIPVDRL